MHMRHKPPIGKGAPTMKRHAHRGGCCAGRPIPKSAKSEPLSGFVFFAGAPISSECGISRGRPPRGGSFFCISRFGKAYSSRYWGSALHRRLRRAPLLGRCGFLRRPNPAAETSRVLWSFRGRFVSRWGGNRNIGGGNLSQGALAPSVCSAPCARCAASQGLGRKIGLFGKTPVFWQFLEWALQAASGELQKEGEASRLKIPLQWLLICGFAVGYRIARFGEKNRTFEENIHIWERGAQGTFGEVARVLQAV